MNETKTEVARSFDMMELLTAILLGLAAIATAFAAFQSALYGGRSVEGYSKANKIATEAAAERSRATVEMAKDSAVDIEAMRLTLEGDDAGNTAAEERNYYIATYLYTRQMSAAGYKALGLPPEARSEDGEKEQEQALQETILEKAMEKDLTDDVNYQNELLTKSHALSTQSEEIFKQAQGANQTGDKFQLAAVIFAISLFFGGIAQVFHSPRMRTVILGSGALIFLVGMIYLVRLPLIFG